MGLDICLQTFEDAEVFAQTCGDIHKQPPVLAYILNVNFSFTVTSGDLHAVYTYVC